MSLQSWEPGGSSEEDFGFLEEERRISGLFSPWHSDAGPAAASAASALRRIHQAPGEAVAADSSAVFTHFYFILQKFAASD